MARDAGETLGILREIGITYGQGYYLGRPAAASLFIPIAGTGHAA